MGGGCSAYDVVEILRKGRQPVSGCEVELRAARAASAPRVFTQIHLHFRVSGEGLAADRVQQTIRLSTKKYYSTTIILTTNTKLTHSYKIIN